jgi:hypothetical protein
MSAALIETAKAGRPANLEDLILGGADVNAADSNGRTPLHVAVSAGRPDNAACLLAYGARFDVPDAAGQLALDARRDPLEIFHPIRQLFRRFRPKRSPVEESTPSPAVDNALMLLQTRGLVGVSGLVPPEALAQLKREFAGFIDTIAQKLKRGGGEGYFRHYDEEEHFWPKDKAAVTNNAFKHSPTFARLCSHPLILEVARRFLGRPAHITRGVGMRYYPSPATDFSMFGWHHDMEEQRLKIMLLLTDVAEDGQAMSYVVGSHRICHPLSMFYQNACSLEYCQARLPKIELAYAAGKAGDLFLFDSNGAHRGNRRENAAVRDVLLAEFTTERSDVWGGDLDPRTLEGQTFPHGNPFEWLQSAEKKWLRPTDRVLPNWITNLPYPERWVTAPSAR